MAVNNKQVDALYKMQAIGGLFLELIEEYNITQLPFYRHGFKKACKEMVAEIEKAGKFMFSLEEAKDNFELAQQSVDSIRFADQLFDILLEGSRLGEQKHKELQAKVNSILYDYGISERNDDYIALYTFNEAKKIIK